ncbi:MAG: SDR family NAD(P)-dependent oxidoreductase [Hyphomicrobiaceae bacterium]
MKMHLDQDTAAVVTGGASGLGAATARLLRQLGAKVAVLDLDDGRGADIATETGARYIRTDVTSEESVRAALEEARRQNGQERLLVNCAGIVIGKRTVRRNRDTGEMQPHDLASFAKVVAVNLVGTFNVTAQSAAGMAGLDPLPPDGERGVIVSTSSIAAEDGQLGQAAYAASKGGVAAMTLPIARDLAASGIRVVSILPGLFDTPMFQTLPEEGRKALARSVPFPARLGSPSEYAMMVRQVCENPMLNGVSIRLDGAARLAAS